MKHSFPTVEQSMFEEVYDGVPSEPEIPTVDPELLKLEGKSALRSLQKPFKAARYDMPTAVFVLLGMMSGLLCRMIIAGNPFDLKAFLSDFAMFSLFSALSYLVPVRRRTIYYIAITGFFSFFLFADGLYFRAHNSVLSLFLLSQLQFLPAVASACKVLVEWYDIFFLVFASTLIVSLSVLKRRGHFSPAKESTKLRISKALTNLTIALVILGFFGLTLTKRDASRLGKQWNRPYLVERFGPYGYHVSDFIKFGASFESVAEIENEQFQNVAKYFEQRVKENNNSNKFSGLLKGQNLVVIHAESLQTMFMFRSINGVEITPNLNRIARKSLYFERFFSQNSIGTSSDSEFTFLTSLYPINRGTVFISHDQRHFVTLPLKLREEGYTAISMHGNNGSFWNREIMNKQLGYHEFYSKKDFEIDEVIGMGLSDMSFFRQSLEILYKTPKPFMATLITLTNHTPFAETEKYGEFDSGIMEGTKAGNYLKSLHYMDRAFGYFFDELEASGLLENTTFLVYGDHPASLDRHEIKTFLEREKFDRYDHRLERNVPLIIFSKKFEQPEKIKAPMGMIDVFPTLANMFGFDTQFCLGNDIFSVEDNRVVFPNGNWLDENVVFFNSKNKYKIHNEEFVEGYLRNLCTASVENDETYDASPSLDSLSRQDELDLCNNPSDKRVFKYRASKPNRSGLGKYAYGYVHNRIQEVSTQLEISSLVLEYDLLKPANQEHTHSLLNIAKR